MIGDFFYDGGGNLVAATIWAATIWAATLWVLAAILRR